MLIVTSMPLIVARVMVVVKNKEAGRRDRDESLARRSCLPGGHLSLLDARRRLDANKMGSAPLISSSDPDVSPLDCFQLALPLASRDRRVRMTGIECRRCAVGKLSAAACLDRLRSER